MPRAMAFFLLYGTKLSHDSDRSVRRLSKFKTCSRPKENVSNTWCDVCTYLYPSVKDTNQGGPFVIISQPSQTHAHEVVQQNQVLSSLAIQ